MFEIDLFDKHIRKFLLLAMLIRRCLLYDYQPLKKEYLAEIWTKSIFKGTSMGSGLEKLVHA